MNFFVDFELLYQKTVKGFIRYRRAGQGPALLMLHGNPQTHVMWHKVAPALTKKFTIICPDIPGYGKSYKPKISQDHENYSKVSMASDMNELMTLLGHKTFYLVGHDRGARISHRLALDFPEKVKK